MKTISKSDVLLGLQWGDEGKGKVVDVIAPKYDVIARFQGGPNAGHTLQFNGTKHVLHTIPSGVFHEHVINIVGNGVVIDPVVFKKEVNNLLNRGVDVTKNVLLSRRAHLILPSHRLIDAASEASKGNQKIGSTLKGIGPSYMDKTGRNGIRVGDIGEKDFLEKYRNLLDKHKHLLSVFGSDTGWSSTLPIIEEEWFEAIKTLKTMRHIDSEHFVNECLTDGKRVLAEGAQGSLLDIDFGSYPFVTSSNTICAGACTGLGLPPSRIGEVYGIFKAYCTRVGGGPFPTELLDETGELIRKKGNEFGSTTGRPRRCGWLDLPALKYAILLNGVTKLIMTKSDVLSYFEQVKVCTHYSYKREKINYLPYNISQAIPVYKPFDGWNCELSKISSIDAIPAELRKYISYLEEELRTPVTMVSVGPDRQQVLINGDQAVMV